MSLVLPTVPPATPSDAAGDRATDAATDPAVRARRLDLAVDVALAGLALIAGVLRDLTRVEPWREPGTVAAREGLVNLPLPAMLALQLLGAVVLLGRRRRPYAVGLTLAALALIHPTFAGILAPYSVARYGSRLRATFAVNAAALVGALAGARLLELVGSTRWEEGDPYTLALLITALTGFGLYLRTRQLLLAELLARAEAAEAARERDAAAARVAERIALAAELHDMVSHWVTLMTLQAGALSVSAADDRVRADAEEIRRCGGHALDELHDLVRVLAREDAEPPDAAQTVQELVCGFAPGTPVELAVDGDPASVPAVVDRTVRRVVREGLVNARKHAPGAAVEVRLDYAGDGVVVRVGNDAPPAAAAARSPEVGGVGLGLAALRRRCELLGGSLRAGTTPTGGFAVEARLPWSVEDEQADDGDQ